jgi:uncharacterized SAM-binding protein YcdF (DUF218 family)
MTLIYSKAKLLKMLLVVSSIGLLWGMAGFFMDGEDEVTQAVDLIVVLGGGLAGERLQLACQLFAQGHGQKGVILTGRNVETLVVDRARFIAGCGVPAGVLGQWPEVANSYQEMLAVKAALKQGGLNGAIVVSDALHMPRLRYLRDRLLPGDSVVFRHSRLGARSDLVYRYHVMKFWFREPLAYAWYRLRY